MSKPDDHKPCKPDPKLVDPPAQTNEVGGTSEPPPPPRPREPED